MIATDKPKATKSGAASGFTLPEIILALVLVGVLAALTIVSWIAKSGDKHALERSKRAAQEMLAAKKTWHDDNPGVEPTAINIADKTKYLTKTSCDGASIKTTNSEVTCGTCFCYQYADGGQLEVASPGTAVNTGTATAHIIFNFDPDGAMDNDRFDPIAMRLYLGSGRITTYGVEAGNSSFDPAYAALWTKQ